MDSLRGMAWAMDPITFVLESMAQKQPVPVQLPALYSALPPSEGERWVLPPVWSVLRYSTWRAVSMTGLAGSGLDPGAQTEETGSLCFWLKVLPLFRSSFLWHQLFFFPLPLSCEVFLGPNAGWCPATGSKNRGCCLGRSCESSHAYTLGPKTTSCLCADPPETVEFGLWGMEICNLLRGRLSRLLLGLYPICYWKETEDSSMLGEVEAAYHQPQSRQSGQTVSCQLLTDLSYHKPGHKVFSLVSPLRFFLPLHTPASSSHQAVPKWTATNPIKLETSLHQLWGETNLL